MTNTDRWQQALCLISVSPLFFFHKWLISSHSNVYDTDTKEEVAGQAIPEIWESSFGLSRWWTITLFICKTRAIQNLLNFLTDWYWQTWAGKPVEVGNVKKNYSEKSVVPLLALLLLRSLPLLLLFLRLRNILEEDCEEDGDWGVEESFGGDRLACVLLLPWGVWLWINTSPLPSLVWSWSCIDGTGMARLSR